MVPELVYKLQIHEFIEKSHKSNLYSLVTFGTKEK